MKEFAGGALFDKPKTLLEEEGLYGLPGTKTVDDIFSFLDENPFLKDHPYFEELLERERLFYGFPVAPTEKAEEEQPARNEVGESLMPDEKEIKDQLPEGVSPAETTQLHGAAVSEQANDGQSDEAELDIQKEQPASKTDPEIQKTDNESGFDFDFTELMTSDSDIPEVEAGQGATGPEEQDQATEKKEFKAESTSEYMEELAASKPSDFIHGVQQAPDLVPKAEGNEKEALETSLPEIEKPTGLPAYGEGVKEKITHPEPKEGKQPEITTKNKTTSVDIDTEHKTPRSAAIKDKKPVDLTGKDGKVDPRAALRGVLCSVSISTEVVLFLVVISGCLPSLGSG